jgi:hypothetical protein
MYRDLRSDVETAIPADFLSNLDIQDKSGLVIAYIMWMSCEVMRCAITRPGYDQTLSLQLHQRVLNSNSLAWRALVRVRPIEVTVHVAEVLRLDKTLILMGALELLFIVPILFG